MTDMQSPSPLAVALKARGLTYTKLAAAADVTETFIRMVERGQTQASLKTLRKIAKTLGVTLDEADRLLHWRNPVT